MIATGMIPEIRQRAHAQRADIGIWIVAHKGSDLFSIHGFTDVSIDQSSSVCRAPDIAFRSWEGGHASLFVAHGQPGGRPFLFASDYGGGYLLADALGGVIRIIVIEISFD